MDRPILESQRRFAGQVAPIAQGAGAMWGLFEITAEGDIIGDDGEVYSLFAFDPESLGDEPQE